MIDPGAGGEVRGEEQGCQQRFREAGDVTLDLAHQDARVEDRWLGLAPSEFDLLWRLSAQPGERLTRQQLLADIWRRLHEPGANRIALHIARLRTKLARAGVSGIVVSHPDGGYVLDAPPGPAAFRFGRAEPATLDTATRLSHAADRRQKD